MKVFYRTFLLPLVLILAVAAFAQQPIPQAARTAKTIAILNDTKSGDVSEGALEQLSRWSHFTVVDDADSADIVLRFDKKTDREKQSSQSTDDKGQTTYSGGMSFSSQVHMRAYLKGSEQTCRIVAVCSPRGSDSELMEPFISASERHASQHVNAVPAHPRVQRAKAHKAK